MLDGDIAVLTFVCRSPEDDLVEQWHVTVAVHC